MYRSIHMEYIFHFRRNQISCDMEFNFFTMPNHIGGEGGKVSSGHTIIPVSKSENILIKKKDVTNS